MRATWRKARHEGSRRPPGRNARELHDCERTPPARQRTRRERLQEYLVAEQIHDQAVLEPDVAEPALFLTRVDRRPAPPPRARSTWCSRELSRKITSPCTNSTPPPTPSRPLLIRRRNESRAGR